MAQDKERGYLESILVQLPGFKGYLAAENRRESDRVCREHLATRLSAAKRAVGEAKRRLLSSGDLAGLEPLDRVSDRLEKVISKLKFADKGYSGFFDKRQIGPAELDRLHEADLALTGLAVSIEERLSGLSRAGAGPEMAGAVQAALDAVLDFETTFDQRKNAMTREV